MKIAVLTSKNQWFIPYAEVLVKKIKDAKLFYDNKDIDNSYDIVFILSYHKIIKKEYLKLHKHNIIIHASDLPKGKGWSPLFWQILKDKKNISFTMFEASINADSGDIYMQETLNLTGYELNKELREEQANKIVEMCLKFLNNYPRYKIPKKQIGVESFYPKRTKKDSELNINKNIKEQFNLLRTVDNQNYPAFFKIDGNKYKLTIEKMKL